MKTHSLLLFTLLAVAPLAHGGTVENFDAKPAFTLEPNTNTANTVSVIDNPTKKGAHVLKITWPSQSGTHGSVNYSDCKVVLTDKPGKYKITARVNTEQVGPEIKGLSIRVLDQFNECFQLSANLAKTGSPGWSEVSWTLDTAHPDTGNVPSWGDQVNNVIDLPVRLLGFAFGFNEGNTPGGALLIGDISVTKLAD